VTAPQPETGKGLLQQLTGPRYRREAFDLLQLAKDAVHGHKMIAERVREHAQLVAQERTADAERRAAESHAEPPAAPPGR
jgi:hypothetical protein